MTDVNIPERDQWHTRDLHVLRSVADLDPRADNWAATMCAEHLLELPDLVEALLALEDGQYVEVFWSNRGGKYPAAVRLRERGRRALGVWPSADGVDGLIESLRAAEHTADDPEDQHLLRRAGAAIGGVSRDIMTDVIAAVMARQSGLG